MQQDADRYDRHRQRMAERSRERSSAGMEIGDLPEVVNPDRKAASADSLRVFCESYFPRRFRLKWSPDHITWLGRMECATKEGGLYIVAAPRGRGKTSSAEVAAIWGIFHGYIPFTMLLGPTGPHSISLIDSIKTELEGNDLLLEDFPEIVYPIRCLESQPLRCRGQKYHGERTHIVWKRDVIVLPTMPNSKASGAILRVSGILGAGVRGPKYTRRDGTVVRPKMVLIDDPQTNASAKSLSQCTAREAVIKGAILGMAGPDQKISGVCCATVVRKGDVADVILDREKHPAWTGQRFKMLYAFPTRMDLWEEYAVRRADELRNDGDGSQATLWYAERAAEMDAGANVAWPECFKVDELSAVQSAMNLYFDDRKSFFAEYQNEPEDEQRGEGQLDAETIAARVNGLERGRVPVNATHVTAFVDVQQKCLFWCVCAWADDFTGAVLDYGSYPDQSRSYYQLSDIQHTLAKAAPGTGLEGSIHDGLTKLADKLLPKEWTREDGAKMRIERMLVDARWGPSTDTVFAWCGRSSHAAIVMPSFGIGIGAASKPFSEYQKRPGETIGFHWRISLVQGKGRVTRNLNIDVNFWKSFIAERFAMGVGDKGALTLFGKKGTDHRMFSEHCASEYRIQTSGRGRTVDEWRLRPEKPDNHFWDGVVGCACAASMLGASLPSSGLSGTTAKRKTVAELMREAKERQGKGPKR